MSYFQNGKGRRLSRSGFLELSQPVPSLPGVSTNFIEKSLHVPVNQIPICQHMPVSSGEIAHVLLLGQSSVFPSRASRFRAQHSALRTQHPSLSLAGAPAERRCSWARKVLSCHYNGPTTGRTAVYVGHVGCWESCVPRPSRSWLPRVGEPSVQCWPADSSFIQRAAALALLRFHQPGTWGWVSPITELI